MPEPEKSSESESESESEKIDAPKLGTRREAFEYLRKLGIINYTSWEDFYFVEKNGILHILKDE